MQYELRNYTVGECVGKALTVYIDHFFLFFGLGFAFGIVYYATNLLWVGLLTRLVASLSAAGTIVGSVVTGLGSLFVSLALTSLFSVVTARLVASRFLGAGRIDGRPSLRGVILPGVITSLLTVLVVMGGFILLIVPGILWVLSYAFSVQCAAVEGLKPREAMKRSRALTKGARGRVFGLSFVVYLVSMVASVPVMLLSALLLQSGFTNGLAATAIAIVTAATQALTLAFTMPFSSAAKTIQYLAFRVERESLDVERLSSDFGSAPAEESLVASF